jgi:hypothetical protein
VASVSRFTLSQFEGLAGNNGTAMIYSKSKKVGRLPGGFFHLEEEKSKTRVFGYGHGEHIKLKDEYGNVWRGSATRTADNLVEYRFRDGRGKSLSGISSDAVVTLRDEHGRTWKGVVD